MIDFPLIHKQKSIIFYCFYDGNKDEYIAEFQHNKNTYYITLHDNMIDTILEDDLFKDNREDYLQDEIRTIIYSAFEDIKKYLGLDVFKGFKGDDTTYAITAKPSKEQMKRAEKSQLIKSLKEQGMTDKIMLDLVKIIN